MFSKEWGDYLSTWSHERLEQKRAARVGKPLDTMPADMIAAILFAAVLGVDDDKRSQTLKRLLEDWEAAGGLSGPHVGTSALGRVFSGEVDLVALLEAGEKVP